MNTDYPVHVKYTCTCNYNQRLTWKLPDFVVCVWRLNIICRIFPKCLVAVIVTRITVMLIIKIY